MFQVGDKVRAFGLDGVVKSIDVDFSKAYGEGYKFKRLDHTMIEVEE